VNVLITIGPQGVEGWRLREISFPVVFVEQIFAPLWIWISGEKRQHAASIQIRWRRDTGGIEHGGHDVKPGNDIRDGSTAGEQFGTAGQHGHAHAFFVSRALIDEAVFTECKAVIAHINDEGGIELAAFAKGFNDAAHAVIDAEERFRIALIVFGDIEIGMVREIYAVPTVALVLNPHGAVLGILAGFRHRLRGLEFSFA